MKKIDRNWITINLCVFAIVLASCSTENECSEFEKGISSRFSDSDTVSQIQLKDLTSFEWEEAYVIEGPRFPDEVRKIIGISYENMLEDNAHLLVFTDKDKIVKEVKSTCTDVDFHRVMDGRGYVRFNYSSQIEVKKRYDGNYYHYQLTPNR